MEGLVDDYCWLRTDSWFIFAHYLIYLCEQVGLAVLGSFQVLISEIIHGGLSMWRVGRKVKLNVYDSRGNPVCQCHSVESAAFIVSAVNKLPRCGKFVETEHSGTGICPLPDGHADDCMVTNGD